MLSQTSDLTESIDSPSRIEDLKKLLNHKYGLRQFYLEAYHRFAECLEKCHIEGKVVELGSGAGFVKQIIPNMITSDIISYPGLDMIIDGVKMPFRDAEVKFFAMLNVLHHVPDAESFFSEITRCLAPGGRVLIADQHVGWFSEIIYKYIHHEAFDKDAKKWSFLSSGPLSGANGALAWIIFKRDREIFNSRFADLQVIRYSPHSPLIYWLSGGMKNWTLVPKLFYPLAKAIDLLVCKLFPSMASFVDIELLKK